MKTFLALLAIFGMNSAVAANCPDISGTYKQTFPVETGAILKIATQEPATSQVLDLSIQNEAQQPWIWSLNLDGESHEKAMGAFYRDVIEIGRCEAGQVQATLAGRMLDSDRTINFLQQWYIYKNTIGELVWQINYQDDTDHEPRISVFKYQAVQ